MHHWFNFVLVLAIVLTALALFFTVGYDMGSRKHSRKPVPPEPETKPMPEPEKQKRNTFCVRVVLRNGQSKIFHQAMGARIRPSGVLAVEVDDAQGNVAVVAIFKSWLYTDTADPHKECP